MEDLKSMLEKWLERKKKTKREQHRWRKSLNVGEINYLTVESIGPWANWRDSWRR